MSEKEINSGANSIKEDEKDGESPTQLQVDSQTEIQPKANVNSEAADDHDQNEK